MTQEKKVQIGILAPSAQVPQIELNLGVEKLKNEGFKVKVHPQCRRSHLFFAGTDQERADAFADYAYDPEIDVIWSARGGHGSIRLLPFLEKMTRSRGRPPHKLFIGYSDSTSIMESPISLSRSVYVRVKCGL